MFVMRSLKLRHSLLCIMLLLPPPPPPPPPPHSPVFGFNQTSFAGFEQENDYVVLAGFLSGRPSSTRSQPIPLTLEFDTAGIMLYLVLLFEICPPTLPPHADGRIK